MDPESPRVILFVKAPIPGQVKTRLARKLGGQAAVRLYKCFVNDLVKKIESAGLHLYIFYDPPDAEAAIRAWLGCNRFCFPQKGKDLGERMSLAFQQTFSGGVQRAVLIGSDLPDLPAEIIANALTALNESPAVIGPSKDGGYYLIGFRPSSFRTDVFEDIPWSSERVLSATLDRFAKTGIPFWTAPEWNDIDTPEDIAMLIKSLTKNPNSAPCTFSYLRRLYLP